MASPTPSRPLAPGRSCGDCTLCCKVMGIAALDKPRGKWCSNCDVGMGCRIYETRPEECATFYCGYMLNPDIDEAWKPSRSKIVLVPEDKGNRVAAHVDPQRPDAWKQEPYYSTLKQWARHAVTAGGQVMVTIGERRIMVFPDKDVDLGVVGADERVLILRNPTPAGLKLDAIKLHKDDPRVQGQ